MNQDAVHWFVERIYQLVRQEVSDGQFWIVGQEPPPAVRKLSSISGVRVTGTVTDVREYYAQAKVFVVPMRLGGGTKLKTLEAMAMGLPVVSTTVGAQGLEVEPGRHLHIADEPEVFAARVVELLQDRRKAISMGAQARTLVEQRYSWERIVSGIEDRLVHLLRERGQIGT
jgi:glycosyltransferase involved in cell wall biosynthesis